MKREPFSKNPFENVNSIEDFERAMEEFEADMNSLDDILAELEAIKNLLPKTINNYNN